jgi:hypothetical protein
MFVSPIFSKGFTMKRNFEHGYQKKEKSNSLKGI